MRIDIWCAFCDAITDPALLQRYGALLTDTERSQQARFHFAEDRHRYLITRALLRTTLSRYADMPPERWRFVPNAYGRPAIANEGISGLTFNLSHSRKLVALAVARNCGLGIDTEDALTRSPPLEIADRFFAPEEVASLRALPADRHLERFFQYWTLKESYIKARGMGLSLPLDQFAFEFSAASRVSLTVRPQLQDVAENWRFWQWWVESGEARCDGPRPQHMLALCAEHIRGESLQLVMREIVPFVSECELRSTLIAATQDLSEGPEG
jgi:4'-phosphopantetheinyl transferase